MCANYNSAGQKKAVVFMESESYIRDEAPEPDHPCAGLRRGGTARWRATTSNADPKKTGTPPSGRPGNRDGHRRPPAFVSATPPFDRAAHGRRLAGGATAPTGHLHPRGRGVARRVGGPVPARPGAPP